MALIWPPPGWLWWLSNVPPSADFRTRAIISRCTESATRFTRTQSSHSANIFQLYSSTWTFFWRTWEITHKTPNATTPAYSRTTDSRASMDWGLAQNPRVFQRWIWFKGSDQWLIGLGQCRRQTPTQPEANWIHLESIFQNDWAGQLQCVQPAEDSMGGWVSGDTVSWEDPGAELFGTASRWAHALGASCWWGLVTLENWLWMQNFDTANWIWWQWIQMFL